MRAIASVVITASPILARGYTEQVFFRSQNIVGLCELRGPLLNFVFQIIVGATALPRSATFLHLCFQF
jgi:hypothetical protein